MSKTPSREPPPTRADVPASSEAWAEEVLQALARQGDAPFDIAEGALALAAFDSPTDRLAFYRDHLSTMERDLADAMAKAEADSPDAALRLVAINHVLFGLHGYSGDTDTYDDLQNANIIRVMDPG